MPFNLEDKLFHTPVSNLNYRWTFEKDLEIKLLKLKRIFDSKKIMCRKSLLKLYPDNAYLSSKNNNGLNYVSLSKHISQKASEDKDSNNIIKSDENAFEIYPWNDISLVLNSDLYAENPKHLEGTRIPLEVQVLGDIDIKYVEAISIPAILGI